MHKCSNMQPLIIDVNLIVMVAHPKNEIYNPWVKAWKKEPVAPKLNPFQGLHFPRGSFLLLYSASFTQIFKPNIKSEAKYDIEQDKNSFFLNQAFHYNQIYNFTFSQKDVSKSRTFSEDWVQSEFSKSVVFFRITSL